MPSDLPRKQASDERLDLQYLDLTLVASGGFQFQTPDSGVLIALHSVKHGEKSQDYANSYSGKKQLMSVYSISKSGAR